MSSKQTKSNASNWPGTKGKWVRDEKKVTEPMPDDKKRVWLFDSIRYAKRFMRSGNPVHGFLV